MMKLSTRLLLCLWQWDNLYKLPFTHSQNLKCLCSSVLLWKHVIYHPFHDLKKKRHIVITTTSATLIGLKITSSPPLAGLVVDLFHSPTSAMIVASIGMCAAGFVSHLSYYCQYFHYFIIAIFTTITLVAIIVKIIIILIDNNY